MKPARRVLVIHPLAETCQIVGEALSGLGLSLIQSPRAAAGLRSLGQQGASLALIDLAIAGNHHGALLKVLRRRFPGLPVMLLAGPGERATAARMLQRGAADFLLLPLEPEELVARSRALLGPTDGGSEASSDSGTAAPPQARELVRRSASMQAAVETLNRIAPTRTTVLLLGESGVGKELFARALHFRSPRRHRPWMPLNCSALPETIIESELFGHEKGAFTGAVQRTRGKFEMAHRGTVFLDEIGDMNPTTQAKLLRVLEEREIMRVGSSRSIKVDVRLLAATNTDLELRMRQGLFREDLFHRLNVITIRIPPLRNRKEDLPELAQAFLDIAVRTHRVPRRRLHPEVVAVFLRYAWPGNVRELKNLMENLILTSAGDVIRASDLPEKLLRPAPAVPAQAAGLLTPGRSVQEVERELIRRTLDHVDGNRTQAARLLQIGVRTLQRKIRLYGLRAAGA